VSGEVVLRAEALVRRVGEMAIVAGASLEIGAAESVALLGPSGCGKTSLLHMLGLLDRPAEGRVLLDGRDPWAASANTRADLRLRRFGFVFQQHNLLGHLTALENVALPAWRVSGSRSSAEDAARRLLDRFGLLARAATKAAVLSTGEAQRVAIARALINRPGVVLADEPTGSLDSASAEPVLAAMSEICDGGAALLVVTHDTSVAARANRTLRMRDGRLVD
jgi:ABC-type lipoprotein export system ATPase subunit